MTWLQLFRFKICCEDWIFLRRFRTIDVFVCFAERERDAKLEAERTFLQEMDEDEYDALTEEQKRTVDQYQLQIKKQRMQR